MRVVELAIVVSAELRAGEAGGAMGVGVELVTPSVAGERR